MNSLNRVPLEICLDFTSIKEKTAFRSQLESLGHKVTYSVKASTTFLVFDRNSENLNRRTADRLNIRVISKHELEEIILKPNAPSVSDSDSVNSFDFFSDKHSSDDDLSVDLTSESTDFSFTSTYTASETFSDTEEQTNKENSSTTYGDYLSGNLFDMDGSLDAANLSASDSSDDEQYNDFLRNSATLENFGGAGEPMDVFTHREALFSGLREGAWEVGTSGEPYFPDIDLNSTKTQYYCPKSFLLKKQGVQRATWCLLQLQFCEEIEQSRVFSGTSPLGSLRKSIYYRVVEKEYGALEDQSGGVEYHHHATSLHNAQQRLTDLYTHKIEVENYRRVSVFQTMEEKQMALCSPSLLTTPLSVVSQSEQNISMDVIEFTNKLMDAANSFISEHLEQMRLNALGELITPTGGSITLSQIMKSETALYKLSKVYKELPDSTTRIPRDKINAIHTLSKEYYSCFGGTTVSGIISSLEQIAEKIELSQLLRDMMQLGEETSALHQLDQDSLAYRSLRCRIDVIPTHEEEYINLSNSFLAEMPEGTTLHNIFTISRASEVERFKEWIERKISQSGDQSVPCQMLYHSSKMEYWYSILSRGLLLPSVDPLRQLVPRTDIGMLGSGLYFSSNPSASIPYGSPGCDGRRVMLCSCVALGSIYDTNQMNTSLRTAPSGYDSVHGVKSTPSMGTAFQDDEFVIYSLSQYYMKYLFEYSIPNDTSLPLPPPETNLLPSPKNLNKFINAARTPSALPESLALNPMPPSNRPSGLIVTASDTYIDQTCQLQGVRMYGKVIDLIGEFTVFQEFVSTNNDVAQAKYIFPLDDSAAVCGFEAFVNGKHIIGSVKEKEEAKEIYQKAIDKGYGAYLMAQASEDRDLFCLNIGNILPHSRVIIKISYITDLHLDSKTQTHKLCIPRSIRQTSLGSENSVSSSASSFMVQLSITMPFDILRMECNHPEYHIKQTRTKASCKLEASSAASNPPVDIEISIQIENANEPRLYVEEDENGHYAAMLSLCPSFDWSPPTETEFIFLVDRSASMKSSFDVLRFTLRLLLSELQKLSETMTQQTTIRFNIVSYGATLEWLFVDSKQITHNAISEVYQFMDEEMYPDLGGSDAWLALNAIYLNASHRHPSSSITHRTIVMLTDGLVTQTEYTQTLITENVNDIRVFTIGIGADVRKTSVQRMAQLGGGTCVCISAAEEAYKNSKKLASQLLLALQPSWRDIQVNWGLPGQQKLTTGLNMLEWIQSPCRLQSLYNGERLLVFYLGNELYTSASVTARSNATEATNNRDSFYSKAEMSSWWNSACTEVDQVVSTHEMAITRGVLIHRLAARSVLREWEEGVYADNEISHHIRQLELKEQIINMSIHYQLVTKFTAFVAIEERFENEVVLSHNEDFNRLWNECVVDDLSDIPWDMVSVIPASDSVLSVETKTETQETTSSDEDDFWRFFNSSDSSSEEEDIADIVCKIDGIQSSLPSGLLGSGDFEASAQNISDMEYVAKETVRARSKHVERLLAAQKVKVSSGGGVGATTKSNNPNRVISYSQSYGRSGGAVKKASQQNAIEQSILVGKQATTSLCSSAIHGGKIITPFGFYATPVGDLPTKIQKQMMFDNGITHLFQGPLNSGGDCWLNAVLMACFSISSFQYFLSKFSQSFSNISSSQQLKLLQKVSQSDVMNPVLLVALGSIGTCWTKFSSLSQGEIKRKGAKYREGLFVAQKRVLAVFEQLGFVSKDPQCAIRVFQVIEEQVCAFVHERAHKGFSKLWISLRVHSWAFTSPIWKLMKKKTQSIREQYVVLFNNDYSALPLEFVARNGKTSSRLAINGYFLHSFVSFENIDENVNHFKTIVVTEEGFVLYNDVLHIGNLAGGYQGAIFNLHSTHDASHPAFRLLSSSCEMVPICIFKRM